MFPAWGLAALAPPMAGCKKQCVLGFPAPAYFAAAAVACGAGTIGSHPGFVSEGQPVRSSICCGSDAEQGMRQAAKLALQGLGVVQPILQSPRASPGALPSVVKPTTLVPETSPPPKCVPGPCAGGASVPGWIADMLRTSFFGSCGVHRALKKNECTFFCASCCGAFQGLCQHCVAEHAGHQVIQIRRYVYCDVVRAVDIAQYVDTGGVQTYIINQAKVMFLNPRPQSKQGVQGAGDTCATCARHLREGAVYCCLACKVAALQAGDDAWQQPVGAPSSVAARDAAVLPQAMWPGRAMACCRDAAPPPAVQPSPLLLTAPAGTAHAQCCSSSSSSDNVQHAAPCGEGDEAHTTPADAAAAGCKRRVGDGGAAPAQPSLSPATMALLHAITATSDEEDEVAAGAPVATTSPQLLKPSGAPQSTPPHLNNNTLSKRQRVSPPCVEPTTPGGTVPPAVVMTRQRSCDSEEQGSPAGTGRAGSAPAASTAQHQPRVGLAAAGATAIAQRLVTCGSASFSAGSGGSRRKQISPRKSAV